MTSANATQKREARRSVGALRWGFENRRVRGRNRNEEREGRLKKPARGTNEQVHFPASWSCSAAPELVGCHRALDLRSSPPGVKVSTHMCVSCQSLQFWPARVASVMQQDETTQGNPRTLSHRKARLLITANEHSSRIRKSPSTCPSHSLPSHREAHNPRFHAHAPPSPIRIARVCAYETRTHT